MVRTKIATDVLGNALILYHRVSTELDDNRNIHVAHGEAMWLAPDRLK